MNDTDRSAVRAEDAFDIEGVHAWLERHVEGLSGPAPDVVQFTGGASNLTYLLSCPHLGKELALRRPPVGARAGSAHDVAREHRVQEALKPVFPLVPEVRAPCRDPSVIGTDFYVMDKVPGVVLRGSPPRGMDLSPGRARALSETFVDTLVDLHRTTPRRPVSPTSAGERDTFAGRWRAGLAATSGPAPGTHRASDA